ncbi:MAG TPA: hypothetical protein VII38_15130 [Polyangia bacterium]|jgi:hypothetical protein
MSGARGERLARGLCLAAGALVLLGSLLPLWECTLRARQYPDEPIRVVLYAGGLGGDLDELGHLNQYIGVHLPASMPELHAIRIFLVVMGGALLLAGLFSGRAGRFARRGAALVLGLGLAGVIFVGQKRLYQIGHDRYAHAPIVGVPDFTPPVLGPAQVGNFHVLSLPASGGWLLATALFAAGAAGLLPKRGERRLV